MKYSTDHTEIAFKVSNFHVKLEINDLCTINPIVQSYIENLEALSFSYQHEMPWTVETTILETLEHRGSHIGNKHVPIAGRLVSNIFASKT